MNRIPRRMSHRRIARVQNICTLYDIDPGYRVMELIEGETLAQRIEKGPIPLDQALKFAAQIADALDRAHRAGVAGQNRFQLRGREGVGNLGQA